MDKFYMGQIGEEVRKTRIVQPMPRTIPLEPLPIVMPIEVPLETEVVPVKR